MNYHDDEDGLMRDHVRRTYMRRLREFSPEKDPEGFRRVREAYEALREWGPADADPQPRFELRVESSAPSARDAAMPPADEPAVVAPRLADEPAKDDPFERWRAPVPAVDPVEALRARLRAIAGEEERRQDAEREEKARDGSS